MEKFFYRVEENDSILSVSVNFFIPPYKIIKLNNLTCEIEKGDLLYLEKEDKNVYMVKPSENIDSIADKFSIEKDEIKRINNIDYVFYPLIISLR